jgi:hypothetical protein
LALRFVPPLVESNLYVEIKPNGSWLAGGWHKRIGQRDCGIVKVGSEEWRAELAHPADAAREIGADVQIVSVEGVTLKVK